MSEYQYYEFLAIDRPLSAADCKELRALSTRARITATSFTNSYEYGDLKGDPAKLMERWFDLHVYVANWGSRRLMMRLPARLVDRRAVKAMLKNIECAALTVAGENLILDIGFEDIQSDEWDDGAGWMGALAPLRADVLAGDLRLFYLLWLTSLDLDDPDPGAIEPLPGIGPLTATLEAFADFIGLDPDLVAAAAERSADATPGGQGSAEDARRIIAALSEGDKTDFLVRLADGDPHVATEMRVLVRRHRTGDRHAAALPTRSVDELVAAAEAVRIAREAAQAAAAAADKRQREEIDARSRRIRMDAVASRGERVWEEIEAEVERRNASGYDRAFGLVADLQALAEESGKTADFGKRLQALHERHAGKAAFVKRLLTL